MPLRVNLSQTLHRQPYPAILPTRPELSQVGRTVLVLGGSTGIGHAIARNFCETGASRVIIVARRRSVLEDAVTELTKAYRNIEVIGRVGSFLSLTDATALWDSLEQDGVKVDVLVLSATRMPALQPLLEQGVARVWEDYEANVHAPMVSVERFYRQPGHDKQKYCVYVSTHLIYNWHKAPQQPGYNLTRNAFTAALSMISRDTPVEKMQIVSFHPGTVFTEAAKAMGLTGREPHIPWFDGKICPLGVPVEQRLILV